MQLQPCRECGAQCRLDDQFCGWCGSRDPIPPPAAAASPRAPRHGWAADDGPSDRLKLVVVLLAFFVPFGVHRLYLGHVPIGIAQLLLAWFCGVGVFWVLLDGVYLAIADVEDDKGRPVTRWT